MAFLNLKSICCFGHGWILGSLALVSVVIAVENPEVTTTSSSSKAVAQTRFVMFEKATVHCGPAKDFYVTSVLARGASVELYHETKDGWCGIRPPDGSHDWLAADQAYLLPGGKQAEVVGNKAPAWIGTDTLLENQRFRWQIELVPTQKVDVIGELEQAIDSDNVRLWYKILPPPGEFRWIRAEALSSTPPKSRTTTVTLASASTSDIDDNEPTQQAAYQTVIKREPVAGEFIQGEGVVIASAPSEIIVSESMPATDEGYIEDQGFIIDESMDGQIVYEDSIIDGDLQSCPSCNQMGCTACSSTHQIDSFQQWEATQATGDPKLRFRPIGWMLGLIGFSIVEGERLPPVVGANCPSGCRCIRCTQNRADLLPRSSGRFDHLPRPSRRFTGQGSSDWLGMNEPNNENLFEFRNSVAELDGRSLLQPQAAASDWQGIAPARLGSSIGSIDAISGAEPIRRNRWEVEPSSVIAASAQAEELHFSTPEIRQAMVELSHAVADSMEVWDLREHAARAQRWIEEADDPIARGEARLLLERIESFERLHRRSLGTPERAYALTTESGFSVSNSLAAGAVPASLAGFQRPIASGPNTIPANEAFASSPTVTQRNPDGTPVSDASGWLVQVHSADFGQPEYALTDDYGGLIAYVQPSPGMNLSRYLKQPVGIYGVKGYLPSLSARQIVAERIVRLR